MKRVCVLLADGFEEIEAVTIIDVLRRAEVVVVTLGVKGVDVCGSHGIAMQADRPLDSPSDEDWDLVILPGGLPGAHTLRDDALVQSLLRRQRASGRAVAAICAAPIALGAAGLLEGRRATSYPGFEAELVGASCVDERVVDDGDVITSRGPGTAMEFSLALVARLCGPERAQLLRSAMLVTA